MYRLVLGALVLAACSKPVQQEPGPTESPAGGTSASESAGAVPSTLLQAGADAPDVESVAHDGQKVRLSEFRGRPVVVYFYPKDDTKGCTIEAQEIRDDWPELTKANAVVLGVSTDDNESHRAFAKKYDLPFKLLPDTDQRIAKAFGVPLQNGKVKRVTFVIDKQGKIAKVFPQVTPQGHSAEILAAIER